MNFFKNLYSFSEIRKNQLKYQEYMDKKIEELSLECPRQTTNFLLNQRKFARKQQQEFLNSNFSNYSSVIEKQLKQNEEIYQNFENIIKLGDTCEICYLLGKNDPENPPLSIPPIPPIPLEIEEPKP
jgi:hypothetical protein